MCLSIFSRLYCGMRLYLHISQKNLCMNIIIKAQSYLTESADMHLMWIMGQTIRWEMVASSYSTLYPMC